MRINNESLWLFADAMAKYLAAGFPTREALEQSAAATPSPALQEILRMAVKRCEQGLTISEALEPGARVFPHYFLPVLRAGEMGGRLVEAFQLVQDYSYRIGPSVRLVRNTWLYPLICILFGWVLRTGIFVYFGKYAAAWQFFWNSFGSLFFFALLIGFLGRFPPVKKFADLLRLHLPLIRPTEIGLSQVLFFGTFRLAYAVGNLGVVPMFDLAAQTVRNGAIRQDWLKARVILEQGGTFEEAFRQPQLVDQRFKGMLATGSVSGRLEECLGRIVELVSQELATTLQTFNQFFQRLVSFCVVMSIVETVLLCVL